MSSQKSRMGGLKLSDFGKSTSLGSVAQDQPVDKAPPPASPEPQKDLPATSESVGQFEVLTTINIKIRRDQHQWLSEAARQVRDNNLEPVPPGDRVYPQHLIGVAIELLRNRKLDWSRIKTVEDLYRQLKI